MSSADVRVRIQPYIPEELRRRLRQQCVSTRCTESAYVTMALEQTIDGVSDRILLLRRLDRLGRANERLQRTLDFLSEVFGTYLVSWFAHMPAVQGDAARKAAARASGEARYRELMQVAAHNFGAGHRLVDDLPEEPIADGDELEAIAARADAGALAPAATLKAGGSRG